VLPKELAFSCSKRNSPTLKVKNIKHTLKLDDIILEMVSIIQESDALKIKSNFDYNENETAFTKKWFIYKNTRIRYNLDH